MKRKIVPEQVTPAAVLKRATETNVTTLLPCKAPMDEGNEHVVITVQAHHYYGCNGITSSCQHVKMWFDDHRKDTDGKANTKDTPCVMYT